VRENAQRKGERYVAQGRLIVDHVSPEAVRATVRGAGAIHRVTWTPGEGWACSCEARTRCSHLVAVMLVTVRSGER
jgi:uncharacterized Zn finger protein